MACISSGRISGSSTVAEAMYRAPLHASIDHGAPERICERYVHAGIYAFGDVCVFIYKLLACKMKGDCGLNASGGTVAYALLTMDTAATSCAAASTEHA
jgi:hypothetical protein